MVENKHIDTYIQKAGIPGFSRCTEHTSGINQIIKEAREDKNFAAMWLDLANAYGSLPLKLIGSAMELYHILEKVQGIVKSYFEGMRTEVTVDDCT